MSLEGIVFIGRISKFSKDRYHIEIPSKVVEKYHNFIKFLDEGKEEVIVIVLRIHGIIR